MTTRPQWSDPTRAVQYQRERRVYRRALGICVACGARDAVEGMALCDPCLETRAEWQAARKARWIADGLCSRCGGVRRGEWAMCCLCRKKQRTQKGVRCSPATGTTTPNADAA